MPLSREDCVDLIREIEALLRQYDPSVLELVLGAMGRFDDPRRHLIDLLRTIRKFYSERSGGMYGGILDGINQFVRLEDGSPIRSLSVALSPEQR
jgi:hypothetical protein